MIRQLFRFTVENKILQTSKLSFWSLRFGHFCHFSPNLKPFASRFLWFHFYCYFGPKIKSTRISQVNSCYFVLIFRGKIVISFLFYLNPLLKQ
ncbi:hypothetical protein Hanom_Chr01g00066871 [Helianthus anomalus]